MTEKEFDAHIAPLGLTWIYTSKPVTSLAFSIGPGWYDITASMITDILALGWDGKVAQLKEKFGGGRFYIGGATKEIFDRINAWENQTFETCEQCGTKENVTTAGGWSITLCTSCREKETK